MKNPPNPLMKRVFGGFFVAILVGVRRFVMMAMNG